MRFHSLFNPDVRFSMMRSILSSSMIILFHYIYKKNQQKCCICFKLAESAGFPIIPKLAINHPIFESQLSHSFIFSNINMYVVYLPFNNKDIKGTTVYSRLYRQEALPCLHLQNTLVYSFRRALALIDFKIKRAQIATKCIEHGFSRAIFILKL